MAEYQYSNSGGGGRLTRAGFNSSPDRQDGAGGGEAATGGGTATCPPTRHPRGVMAQGQQTSLGLENQRLKLDNARLWGCMSLIRNERHMTCQAAINHVFGLPDDVYIKSIDRQSREGGRSRKSGDQEDPQTENLRLREENKRLHAALWVLRDNPALQADSTLAAVFRLDEEQFRNKFNFDYDGLGQGLTNVPRTVLPRNNNKPANGSPTATRQNAVDLAASQSKFTGQSSIIRRSRSVSARRPRRVIEKSNSSLHHRSNSVLGQQNFSANGTSGLADYQSWLDAQEDDEQMEHLVDLVTVEGCCLHRPPPSMDQVCNMEQLSDKQTSALSPTKLRLGNLDQSDNQTSNLSPAKLRLAFLLNKGKDGPAAEGSGGGISGDLKKVVPPSPAAAGGGAGCGGSGCGGSSGPTGLGSPAGGSSGDGGSSTRVRRGSGRWKLVEASNDNDDSKTAPTATLTRLACQNKSANSCKSRSQSKLNQSKPTKCVSFREPLLRYSSSKNLCFTEKLALILSSDTTTADPKKRTTTARNDDVIVVNIDAVNYTAKDPRRQTNIRDLVIKNSRPLASSASPPLATLPRPPPNNRRSISSRPPVPLVDTRLQTDRNINYEGNQKHLDDKNVVQGQHYNAIDTFSRVHPSFLSPLKSQARRGSFDSRLNKSGNLNHIVTISGGTKIPSDPTKRVHITNNQINNKDSRLTSFSSGHHSATSPNLHASRKDLSAFLTHPFQPPPPQIPPPPSGAFQSSYPPYPMSGYASVPANQSSNMNETSNKDIEHDRTRSFYDVTTNNPDSPGKTPELKIQFSTENHEKSNPEPSNSDGANPSKKPTTKTYLAKKRVSTIPAGQFLSTVGRTRFVSELNDVSLYSPQISNLTRPATNYISFSTHRADTKEKHRQYPHKSYSTPKHFLDRHSRLMKQSSDRCNVGKTFFTREKTPSTECLRILSSSTRLASSQDKKAISFVPTKKAPKRNYFKSNTHFPTSLGLQDEESEEPSQSTVRTQCYIKRCQDLTPQCKRRRELQFLKRMGKFRSTKPYRDMLIRNRCRQWIPPPVIDCRCSKRPATNGDTKWKGSDLPTITIDKQEREILSDVKKLPPVPSHFRSSAGSV